MYEFMTTEHFSLPLLKNKINNRPYTACSKYKTCKLWAPINSWCYVKPPMHINCRKKSIQETATFLQPKNNSVHTHLVGLLFWATN